MSRCAWLNGADVHPDPFYEPGSSSDSDRACHAGTGSAGYYGAEVTSCDSPYSLANATFDWIRENLKDEIDFVVWTGDSARHDNDERHPRSVEQVVDQNKYLVHKFVEVFGKSDNIDDRDPTNDFVVPIIPTFGNNDILPHNILTPGPNKWTRRYTSIWRKFVPEEQRHSFERGGWFFTEVIPNKLAVFSLNTIYFFESNSAVDGCNAKSEPGYEHMEWLRIQLQFLRQRDMKAIMTGHVPPARTESKQNWDESCWQKYTLWMRQYRDVVVGGLYGHMNIDHFIFQDTKNLDYDFRSNRFSLDDVKESKEKPLPRLEESGDDFSIMAKSTYLNELRDYWSGLPAPPRGLRYSGMDTEVVGVEKDSKKEKQRKKFLRNIGGPWAERFSLSLVAPSVVPNYYPTLRVIEYNISGLEHEHPSKTPTGVPETLEAEERKSEVKASSEQHNDEDADTTKRREKQKPSGPGFKVPQSPSKSSPPGPAYSPQTFTFLSLTQYYANLTTINAKFGHGHRHTYNEQGAMTSNDLEAWRKEHNVNFTYEVEYDTRNDKMYKLKDLTLRSWLDLAQGMRKGKSEMMTGHLIDDNEGEIDSDLDFKTAKWSRITSGLGDVESASSQDADTDDVDEQKQKREKRKNHKKKRKLRNKTWKTFVKRAFVLTKPDEELDDEFGEEL